MNVEINTLINGELAYHVAMVDTTRVLSGWQQLRHYRNIFGELMVDRGAPDLGWEFFSPSRLWQQGGPIIEAAQISLKCYRHGEWYAYSDHFGATACGETALIAAMRVYVKNKFGEFVKAIP